MHVDGFKEREGISLLQQFVESSGYTFSEATTTLAELIVYDLDNFPLAVAMAGARIHSDLVNGVSAEKAMSALRKDFRRRAASLAKNPGLAKVSSYRKTMWSIWDSTIDLIESTSPGSNSSELAHLLAFLDPGIVLTDWFRLAADGVPPSIIHTFTVSPSGVCAC